MKKFLLTCFFLIIIAGLCFFCGWAQASLPQDSYGVLRSKTHGIYPETIKPGDFKWVWYKLVPANAKTYYFRLNPVTRDFAAKSILPSGLIYSAFTGMENDFSWEIQASIAFSIDPDHLVNLVSENNISAQEELALYEQETAKQVEYFLLRRFDAAEEASGKLEPLLINGESPALEREVMENFPQIRNFSLKANSAKLPNFHLYRQAKELHQEYFERQKAYILHDLDERAKNRAESFFRFDELEQLGALLTRYPVLLDYLAAENAKK